MKPCAWRELERWGGMGMGTIWKETWGTSSSKGKEEEKGMEKSSEQRFWGGTGRWGASEGRLTLHRLRDKQTPGETEGNGADFETQECEENLHRCVGKQLGIKEQETKGWGGVVRSQLRSDNGSLQQAYLCESMSQDFSDCLETSIPAQPCGISGLPRTLLLLLLRPGEPRN